MAHKVIANMLFLFLLFGYLPNIDICSENDPRIFVTNFYRWYFIKNNISSAVFNDDIYKYVSKKAVAEIRKRNDLDYFTQGGTDSLQWQNVNILIEDCIFIGNNIYLAHVVLEVTYKRHLIVFIENINAFFYIFKVVDIFPYS